jgi:hypothetical protein
MITWTPVLLLAAAAAAYAASPQETKPIPKDSVQVVTQGCLKGRAFYAIGRGEVDPRREEPELQSGPNVAGYTFRLAGPKPVMQDVKTHNGKVVEVVGLVRKAALADNAPGRRIGNTRVTIGGGQGAGTTMGRGGIPVASVAVMDVTSVRYVSDVCPVRQ